MPPHEAAARLFATMAYPLSEPRRQTFERAICNKAIRAAAADPTWRSTVQMIRPEHALMNADKADGAFSDGLRVINQERIIAGKMAAPAWAAFVRSQTGIIHPRLVPVGPTSQPAWTAAAIDLDERRGVDTATRANVISRVWMPSKPALHICLAVHKAIHDNAPDQYRRGLNLGDFLYDRALVELVLEMAACVFEAAPAVFNISHADMVEIITA
jgi:hypothetical protein